MTSVHPAYDAAAGVWFVGSVEAGSLRELKNKLPPRTKIEGYFPRGFSVTRTARASSMRPVGVSRLFFTRSQPQRTLQKPPAPTQEKVETAPATGDRVSLDAILDDWAQGMSVDKIADKHGLVSGRSVRKRIDRARDDGDPRATKRKSKPGLNHYDHDTILDLWATGLTGPEIGERLGLANPTTAGGIVAMYRKRGDPRAVVRNPLGVKN